MQNIFLSYSSKDRDRLAPLVAALEAEGWSVFWDHRAIKVAQDWHDIIGTAIKSCPCVIVAWSKDAVRSKWVREEALIARDRGVLYPIMIDSVEMPFGFTLIQAADFTHWDHRRDHPEFVELRDQLSMRLNLNAKPVAVEVDPVSEKPFTPEVNRPVVNTRPVKQSVMGTVDEGLSGATISVERPSVRKWLSGFAAVGALAGAAYWSFQPSGSVPTPTQQQEDIVQSQAVAVAPVESKPVVTPTPTPAPKTYAVRVAVSPADAVVRINDQPLTAGQRFPVGSYTLTVAAEGYQPYEQRIEVAEADQDVSVVMTRLRLPFEPEMVAIPEGTFMMGCLPGRDDLIGSGCYDDEKPWHQVTVPSFWLSETEVTVGQYQACIDAGACAEPHWREKGSEYHIKTGSKDYYKKLGKALTDENQPIVGVSWNNAQSYLQWLSQETGKTYRLPAESEWEYAARAGTDTAYPWGKSIGKGNANCFADHCGDSYRYTAPVGSFAANQFGLKDMHGNVWEWVEDCRGGDYKNTPNNGTAYTACDADASRVLRGGSWGSLPWYLRSANRYNNNPSVRNNNVGFRAARTN